MKHLSKILKEMEEDGFLLCSLGKPVHTSHYGSFSFMGIVALSEGHLARRLDIKIYPIEQIAFALLYFTGSDHFN